MKTRHNLAGRSDGMHGWKTVHMQHLAVVGTSCVLFSGSLRRVRCSERVGQGQAALCGGSRHWHDGGVDKQAQGDISSIGAARSPLTRMSMLAKVIHTLVCTSRQTMAMSALEGKLLRMVSSVGLLDESPKLVITVTLNKCPVTRACRVSLNARLVCTRLPHSHHNHIYHQYISPIQPHINCLDIVRDVETNKLMTSVLAPPPCSEFSCA